MEADSPASRRIGDPMVIAVIALGLTQIIAWGTSLYALGVLGLPIVRDTGWSQSIVFGGLTLGLLVSSVVSARIGRMIDQRGGRIVMTVGSVLLAVGLAILAWSPNPAVYLAAWAFLGVAMRLTLYDAAFAALVQVTPARGRRAISYLTLFGGVASTVFWPIGFALDARYGWRATFLVFAAINLAVCVPLHWFGLARRDPAPASSSGVTTSSGAHGPVLEGRERRHAMLLFGLVTGASAYCYGALAAHLVTVLGAAGLAAGAAVTLASAKGVMQTIARFGDLVFGRNLHPLDLGRITLAFLPAAFAVLLWGGGGMASAIVFVVLFGIANGLTTIVRGAVPLALFGPAGYGEILGRLATPYLVVNASAPMVFALIAETWGAYAAALSLLVVGTLAFVAIEIMALWYRRATARSRSLGTPGA